MAHMAQRSPDSEVITTSPPAAVYQITLTTRDKFVREKGSKEGNTEWYIGDCEINNGRHFMCTSAADVRAIVERIEAERANGEKIRIQFDQGIDVAYKPTTDSSIEVYSGKTRVLYDGKIMPQQRRRRNSQNTEINYSVTERAGPGTQRRLEFHEASPGPAYAAVANELMQTIDRAGCATNPEDSDWEEEESEGCQWDEPIPQRNRVNHKRARPLSKERRRSSHAREHIELAGRKTLTQPRHNLKKSIRREEPEYMQKIFLAATGLTADEILDMPGTSSKAKQDMIAEQQDACQKALALCLRLTLPTNKNRSGRDPIMGDIF